MAITADEARAVAEAKAKAEAKARAAAAEKAKTAAAKAAAAKKTAAAKAAAAKAAAAKKKKDDAYFASFANPITSRYDTRVYQNTSSASQPTITSNPAGNPTDPFISPTITTITPDANPIIADVPIKPKEITDATRDAFAMLTDLFASYGLGSLASEIAGYMSSGLTASEALIKLKTNPSGGYAARFAGNFARTKKGLNVLSESAYIELEDSYANTLKSYGLGNMLSTDPNQNWKQFSEYIANDISSVEFKDRISSVQDRVVNADPAIKAMFKEFYPSLTDKDLVAYFLNPTETIGKLKEKVTSAEIGAAFTAQGLATSLSSASDLARYGIDRADAIKGASSIASVLPEASKLGDIYSETGIKYTQKTGEEEFLKSNVEAERKRNVLASKERANFAGSAGGAAGAYSTAYLKKNSTAGQI